MKVFPTFGTAVAALALCGCGDSDAVGVGPSASGDFGSLFDAPTASPTAGSIYGLWGGRSPYDSQSDVRWRIDADRTTVAMRCDQAVTVGVTVAARVDERSLATLESKAATKPRGDGRTCRVNVTPETLRYLVMGSQLTLTDDAGGSIHLTKLAD